MTVRTIPPIEPTEKDFTAQVIQLARTLGWKVLHMRPAMSRNGRWATHVQGDGVGFPDLLMVRGRRRLSAELKVGNKRLEPAQEEWLGALSAADIPAYVWRPADFDHIAEILR